MRARWLFATIVSAGILVNVAPGQDKKYEMTHVKYAGLKDEILKHRGKVLVLDFWAGY
jgi:hypothetical protein